MNSCSFRLKRTIIVLFLFLGLFFGKTEIASSITSINLNNNQQIVIEHLRLKVPKEYQKAWLKAEEVSWEPWLEKKEGFIGRQLFWDPKNEEATLLISWASYENWKSIPQDEIDLVQKQFEEIVKNIIGKEQLEVFPLIYEGELLPQ